VDGAMRVEGECEGTARAAGSLARVRVLGSTPYDLFGRFEAADDGVLPLVGGRV
jgi:hypothetical protein